LAPAVIRAIEVQLVALAPDLVT